MVALRFRDFAAMFPIRDPRQLPDNAAVAAVNLRPDSGALDGTQVPRPILALKPGTRSVYRVPIGPLLDLAASYWMQFTDPFTDVIRTPVVNDSFERYYWCSPSTGLRFATKAMILAGQAGFPVGVQVPSAAPSLQVLAGTGAIDPATGKNTGPILTRSYLATFVNEFGEESQPSGTVEATGSNDQDWQVSRIPQPVAQPGYPSITKIRLYRTVTGASGATNFYRVVDLQPGAIVYTDRLSDSVVSGQGLLGSLLAAPPPAMDGISLMPGGIFVGWKGNNLYFSEPYKPSSWPAEYTLTVQFPIVGLGVFGNTAVVCTTGQPATVSGTTPDSMSLTMTDTALPCLSRKSIVSAPEGVYFASTLGLVLIGPAGINVINESVIGRDKWHDLYAPASIQGTLAYGRYAGLRTRGGDERGFLFATTASFQVTSPLPQSQTGVIDFDGFAGGSVCGTDMWSGKAWYIAGGTLYEWFPYESYRRRYRWRSREAQIDRPRNLAVAAVFFDAPEAGLTRQGNEWIRLRVIADGRMVYDQKIDGRSGEVIRLPTGFKAVVWQVEIEAQLRVHEIQLGGTVSDLKGV